MSVGYQIFNLQAEWDTHEDSINTLLGVPALGCTGYRVKIKSFSESKWAGTVTQILVDACASMTPAERLVYYDDAALQTPEYMNDPANGWVPSD